MLEVGLAQGEAGDTAVGAAAASAWLAQEWVQLRARGGEPRVAFSLHLQVFNPLLLVNEKFVLWKLGAALIPGFPQHLGGLL